MTPPDQVAVDSLARYFMWAEALLLFHEETWKSVMRDSHLTRKLQELSPDALDGMASEAIRRDPHRILAAISYSLASLHVVIEGYETLDLSDSRVDQLLSSPHVGLLRRYRNGVFHFQRTLVNDRFTDLLEVTDEFSEWQSALRVEFRRVLKKWAPAEMERPAPPSDPRCR